MKKIVIIAALLVTGCTMNGPTIMVSKGRASLLARIAGADGEYCKITTTTGTVITEEDRVAMREFCKSDQQKLIEKLAE